MMQKTLTQEYLGRITEIVGQALRERFASEFVFDPIEVMPEIDEYGDEYLHVLVVFDGDQTRLDPVWTVSMPRLIQPQLDEAYVHHFLTISYIEKSEWKIMGPRFLRGRS